MPQGQSDCQPQENFNVLSSHLPPDANGSQITFLIFFYTVQSSLEIFNWQISGCPLINICLNFAWFSFLTDRFRIHLTMSYHRRWMSCQNWGYVVIVITQQGFTFCQEHIWKNGNAVAQQGLTMKEKSVDLLWNLNRIWIYDFQFWVVSVVIQSFDWEANECREYMQKWNNAATNENVYVKVKRSGFILSNQIYMFKLDTF